MGVEGDEVDDVGEEAVTVLRVVLVGRLEIDTDDVDDVEPPPPSSDPQAVPKSPVLLNASDDWPDVISNLVVLT